MSEYSGVGLIPLNDFIRVHSAKVIASRPDDGIGQAWVRIDQGCLHLECGAIVHPVSVYHVSNLEARKAYLTNASQLIRRVIALNIRLDMSEHSVGFALAYVKSFTVAWVDQTVNISL